MLEPAKVTGKTAVLAGLGVRSATGPRFGSVTTMAQ